MTAAPKKHDRISRVANDGDAADKIGWILCGRREPSRGRKAKRGRNIGPRRLFFAMPNPAPHASLLATDLSTPLTSTATRHTNSCVRIVPKRKGRLMETDLSRKNARGKNTNLTKAGIAYKSLRQEALR